MSELQELEERLDEKLDTVKSIQEGNSTQLQSLSKLIGNLVILLTGNELNKKDEGYIGKVIDLEDRLKKLENWKNRAIWIGTGMSIGSGYALWDIVLKFVK